ncbi:unnamed protein product [Polarella glacialis]|uniref:Protochlorophyllide reductase n=1 Tax=Polarella glacialis TaxID=89957 RepID=A0A813EW29_POLGL|nr:unnamed protein product [Polarella glacialis]|mmetsp:Transcript_55698/g.100146  ORF Transcript_55698/g.100146 Transcript_55698/m.100146 type:complete len:303 (+) Transcript_55698:130-1038(+)
MPGGTEGGMAVLVTGANRGIGLEVVRSILDAGSKHFVFLGCRDLAAGQALERKFCADYGQRVQAVQLDVTSADSIARALGVVGQQEGSRHLDILVNNAGILLEGDGALFDIEAVRRTMAVNFEGAVAVTEAFLPLLARAPGGGGQVLSTSSGIGARTMGLLSAVDRQALLDEKLDLATLRTVLGKLVEGLENPNSCHHSIPTVGYGLSKLGVNCFTQILARQHPSMRINAVSPGFCNTDMCANYTGQRKPKAPDLGASVFAKVMFGELGRGRSGTFFKENSKVGTPLNEAVSDQEPWVTESP